MRIVHVANFNIKKNGAVFYDTSRLLTNGFIRAGHSVFDFSDRDTARAGNPFRIRKLGVRYANRRLIELCENYKPDLICFGHADVIRPDTLAAIRGMLPSVRMLQWNVDPLFNDGNVARIASKVPHVDATFITTAGPSLARFARPGHVVGFMPNPVDGSIFPNRGFERSDQPNDLIYCVATDKAVRPMVGITGDVNELGRRIKEAVPELACAFHGLMGGGTVWGHAYLAALAGARMGLSLNRRNDHYLYASDRMAHLTSSGLLTFVDRRTGFGDFYGEEDLAYFDDFDELARKLRFFKHEDAERRRVAGNGWRRSMEEFNGTVVAQYLIERVFGLALSRAYAWPTDLR